MPIDLDEITRGKFDFDVVSYDARPDVLKLIVDEGPKPRPAESVIAAAIRVNSEDVRHSAVERRFDADLVTEFDDAAREPSHLESVAALQVVIHRRRHVSRNPVRELQSLLSVVLR